MEVHFNRANMYNVTCIGAVLGLYKHNQSVPEVLLNYVLKNLAKSKKEYDKTLKVLQTFDPESKVQEFYQDTFGLDSVHGSGLALLAKASSEPNSVRVDPAPQFNNKKDPSSNSGLLTYKKGDIEINGQSFSISTYFNAFSSTKCGPGINSSIPLLWVLIIVCRS